MRILTGLVMVGLLCSSSGCVVAPIAPPRAYVARPVVVAPAPVVVVRPYYRYRW